MKYDIKELKMNNKLLLSAALCALINLSGCAFLPKQPAECLGGNCAPQAPVQPQTPVQNSNYICQTSPDTGLCETDPFVNYTNVAAPYRAYGERSPRDQFISQAAAGNNMSASIPPSIEDEVVAYQNKAAQPVEPTTTQSVSETITVSEQTTPVETPAPASAAMPAPVAASEPVAAPVATPKPVEKPAPFATPAPQTPAVETQISVQETVTPTDTETVVTEQVEETVVVTDDPVQDWIAEEGQNLKLLLTEWSEKSGWRLVWNTNRNYVLNAGAMFRGRFADVSSALIRAFARARPAPIATFYKGNRVLVVETMEDENAYE